MSQIFSDFKRIAKSTSITFFIYPRSSFKSLNVENQRKSRIRVQIFFQLRESTSTAVKNIKTFSAMPFSKFHFFLLKQYIVYQTDDQNNKTIFPDFVCPLSQALLSGNSSINSISINNFLMSNYYPLCVKSLIFCFRPVYKKQISRLVKPRPNQNK